MKRLLIPLLVLLCFSASAQVVTPVIPQFTRKVPNDSILTAKVPNIALSFKLPDTSWVKKYSSTYFVHDLFIGTGTFSDPFGIANGYITPAMLHSISGVPGPDKFYSGTGDWLTISPGVWGSITGTLSDQTDLQSALDAKQVTLVSGTNIKTINSASLLGSGNILLQTPLVANTDYLTPTGSAAGLTGLLSSQVTTALGFTPENVANKATSFGTINNTLYPSVQAVNTQLGNYVPLIGGVTITGEVQSSYTPLAANDLARLTDLGLVPTVLSGMGVTVSGITATIGSGTYRLNNITYTYPGGTVTIPAQDGTQYRYSILYITTAGAISVTNGALVPSDPVIPDFPSNSVDVSTIYIPPTGNTIIPTGGGNKGTGTVTKVTSSTADILVANQTTTPILTLNKVNGFAISFYDPTSSIQTQLNSKLSTSTASTTYVPLTRTVNGKALSGNITLGLASSDFANQGTTTTLLHGNAAGNPSFGQIVNADITNSTIDLTTKVTGLLPVANGGTGTSTPGIVAGTNITVSGTWPNQTVNSTGGGLSSSNFVTAEVPTGSINSSNTSYTLANTPTTGTVKIFRNGLRQIVGTDYTISGTAVTYLYAPNTGDSLIVDYQK